MVLAGRREQKNQAKGPPCCEDPENGVSSSWALAPALAVPSRRMELRYGQTVFQSIARAVQAICSRIASIGTALYKYSKPHYSSPLVSVTSQVLSGRQNKDVLDRLAEVGFKVPKVPSQEMSGTSFDGSQ